jgi:hypothetical protein
LPGHGDDGVFVRGQITVVMPGLVPGIHVLCAAPAKQNVDGRDIGAKQSFVAWPGHDDAE